MFRRVCAIVFVVMIVSPVNAPFHPLDVASANAEVTPIGANVLVRIQSTPLLATASIVASDLLPSGISANVFRSRPMTDDSPTISGDYSPLTTVIRF